MFAAGSDGQAHQAVGNEEDCRIHRGGGAYADRLHLPEGGCPQPPTEHSERRRHGQSNGRPHSNCGAVVIFSFPSF